MIIDRYAIQIIRNYSYIENYMVRIRCSLLYYIIIEI